MQNTPTISVKGVGHVSVPPDLAVITLTLSAVNEKYAECTELVNERVKNLRARLQAAQFESTALKTTEFEIDLKESFRDGKRVIVGWEASHTLRLELPVDRALLNKAFAAFANEYVESEIQVAFEVRDKDALRALVLDNATRTARRNAETIASAAGCRLGPVLRIEYGWSEIRVKSMDYSMLSNALHHDLTPPDIEPEDVKTEDSVTMVFELVQ